MAAKSIFGSSVSLPCAPALYSSCEEELLNLLKEVDLVVEKRRDESVRKIHEVQSVCKLQKDEIDYLGGALKQKDDECSLLQQQLCEERKSHLSQEEQLMKQIIQLKEENLVLRQKNKQLHQEVKEVDIDDLQIKASGELVKKLQAEIAELKNQVWMKEQQLNCVESSYQHLLNELANLQQELREKENGEKNRMLKYLDLNHMDGNISEIMKQCAKHEEDDMKDLELKISKNLDLLQENLKKSLVF